VRGLLPRHALLEALPPVWEPIPREGASAASRSSGGSASSPQPFPREGASAASRGYRGYRKGVQAAEPLRMRDALKPRHEDITGGRAAKNA
jgi:hypothetical protein